MRTTREVFEAHLRLRTDGDLHGDLHGDLVQNYADDVVLLSEDRPMVGHDAIRTSAEKLHRQLPDGRFEFLRECVHGKYAFLLWRGESARTLIDNGADTFVIRDGRIVMQSIHYVIHRKAGE